MACLSRSAFISCSQDVLSTRDTACQPTTEGKRAAQHRAHAGNIAPRLDEIWVLVLREI